MLTEIPIPARVFQNFRKSFWEDKAKAIEKSYPGQDIVFKPVSDMVWRGLVEKGTAEAKRLNQLGLPKFEPPKAQTKVEAKETWKPHTVQEWGEMQGELDRMYDLGELGKRAVVFGKAGAYSGAQLATGRRVLQGKTLLPTSSNESTPTPSQETGAGQGSEGDRNGIGRVRGARRAAYRRLNGNRKGVTKA